jgi:hypothetical protein
MGDQVNYFFIFDKIREERNHKNQGVIRNEIHVRGIDNFISLICCYVWISIT